MSIARRILVVSSGLIASTLALGRESPHWPQFRGPSGRGVAERPLPERWSARENVAWSTEIPGHGWSSPVLAGGKVFLTTAVGGKWKAPSTGIYGNDYFAELRNQGLSEEEAGKRVVARDIEKTDEVGEQIEWRVYCLDAATGRVLWQRQAHRGQPSGGRHRKNTYASETPATDGERLFVYFGNVGIFCYSLDGALLWTKRFEPRRIYLDFGTASSPIVDGGRVYVQNDNEEASFLAAFDARTGNELWRTARDFGELRTEAAWATPCLWRNSVRAEIVTLGPSTAVSYDLAGKELWRVRGTSIVGTPTPVAGGDTIYIGSGAQGEPVRPIFAVRAGASGDVSLAAGEESNRWVAWYQKLAGPYITTPLLYENRLYVLYDAGILAALDPATGAQIYKGRIDRDAHAFSASPIAAGGKIYCLSEDGDTYVLAAGGEHRLVGRNSLGEMALATPAAGDGALFIRTTTRLWRIGRR